MEVFAFILIAAVVWYWYSGSRAHEIAEMAARRACERHGVQLLDDTVALQRTRPRRSRDGVMRLRWEYGFEFSGAGEQRLQGRVVVFAGRAFDLQLDFPSGTTYEHQ